MVKGVSFDAERERVTALVGESGSGKTTLARTLVGLQAPTSGEVRLDGAPLGRGARALKRVRRQVQMVLQDPAGALNPRHTVYESVAEGLRLHGLSGGRGGGPGEEEQVGAALAAAGLRPPERFYLRYPHELSGGQRQRVLIAGALALEPRLLVADEPVSSLDASVRGELLALLLRLREERGLGVLVVTHDLGLAWNIADRTAVMYLGRVVESGPTEQVLGDPQHPYTRALLSVVPESRRVEPVVLAGEIPDPTRIPGGCRFHPRCRCSPRSTTTSRRATWWRRATERRTGSEGVALPAEPALGVGHVEPQRDRVDDQQHHEVRRVRTADVVATQQGVADDAEQRHPQHHVRQRHRQREPAVQDHHDAVDRQGADRERGDEGAERLTDDHQGGQVDRHQDQEDPGLHRQRQALGAAQDVSDQTHAMPPAARWWVVPA